MRRKKLRQWKIVVLSSTLALSSLTGCKVVDQVVGYIIDGPSVGSAKNVVMQNILNTDGTENENLKQRYQEAIYVFEHEFANCEMTEIWEGSGGDEKGYYICINFNVLDSEHELFATVRGWEIYIPYNRKQSVKTNYSNLGVYLHDAYYGKKDYDVTFYKEIE